MILDTIEENGVEIMFSYSPAWEMFFSMHVLAHPVHHAGRRKWWKAQEERYPELTGRIRNLSELTNDWVLLIDIPAWDRLRGMEIPELLVFLRNRNIYEWNDMICPMGKKMSILQRDEVLDVITEYYHSVFQREELILRSYLLRALKEEKCLCEREGIWKWCSKIHPRLQVGENSLTYLKNREYSYEKSGIRRIYASVSTFVEPHLWLYEENQSLEIVKGIGVEPEERGIPKDLVMIFKALGDATRLDIIRLLQKGICTTKELAEQLSVSEAAVSKHLKILKEAGLVKKTRKGSYVEYRFVTEVIDFIPYTFYENIR